MQIVVFGATGRIGSKVVDEALSRGWNVRAAVRGQSRPGVRTRLTTVGVDLDDPERVGAAVGDADAVVACLGPRKSSSDQVAVFAAAARRIIAAMERQRVFRLIVLSGAGVRIEGERSGKTDGLLGPLEGRPDRWNVAAKQAEYDVFSRQPARMDRVAAPTRRRWDEDRAVQAERDGSWPAGIHHAGRHRGRDRRPGARRPPDPPGAVPVDTQRKGVTRALRQLAAEPPGVR